jgi:hypothetical protein
MGKRGAARRVESSVPVWSGIVQAADDHDASVIVMGSHGRTGLVRAHAVVPDQSPGAATIRGFRPGPSTAQARPRRYAISRRRETVEDSGTSSLELSLVSRLRPVS